jgi:hypothetical protein
LLGIAVTGYINEKIRQLALSSGFDFWFTKPLDLNDVDRPELSGREAILNIHAQKVKLGKDVNLKAIALLIAETFSSDREF